MATRVHGIRFDDEVWRLITQEATLQGLTPAQFIREAAFARGMFALARRGTPMERWEELYAAAERALQATWVDDPGAT